MSVTFQYFVGSQTCSNLNTVSKDHKDKIPDYPEGYYLIVHEILSIFIILLGVNTALN